MLTVVQHRVYLQRTWAAAAAAAVWLGFFFGQGKNTVGVRIVASIERERQVFKGGPMKEKNKIFLGKFSYILLPFQISIARFISPCSRVGLSSSGKKKNLPRARAGLLFGYIYYTLGAHLVIIVMMVIPCPPLSLLLAVRVGGTAL